MYVNNNNMSKNSQKNTSRTSNKEKHLTLTPRQETNVIRYETLEQEVYNKLQRIDGEKTAEGNPVDNQNKKLNKLLFVSLVAYTNL